MYLHLLSVCWYLPLLSPANGDLSSWWASSLTDDKMVTTPLTEIELLREELQQLTDDFTKANEERAQAAKYGLHVLEEKQALQSK